MVLSFNENILYVSDNVVMFIMINGCNTIEVVLKQKYQIHFFTVVWFFANNKIDSTNEDSQGKHYFFVDMIDICL